jgi:hypothetical protein
LTAQTFVLQSRVRNFTASSSRSQVSDKKFASVS